MKKNLIFWVGYSDMMTSLFFIMLVLFTLTVGYLQIRNKEITRLMTELQGQQAGLIEEIERVNKLLNMEQQFAPLIDDNSFYYLENCKKFIVREFMGVEIFDPNSTRIRSEYVELARRTGFTLERFLRKLTEENKEISYLLVIEGNMANDFRRSIPVDRPDYYRKSYERALAVYNLWLHNGIDFRKYNVEVMLCGSGLSGICRDPVEENNKRFSIQIIPKVAQ